MMSLKLGIQLEFIEKIRNREIIGMQLIRISGGKTTQCHIRP